MHPVLFLAFFFFFTPVVPVSNPFGRISNGFNGAENGAVDAGRYPFMVSVTFNDNHICGGFIYNSRFIVTAASCVYQKTTSQVQVTVGQISLILPDPGELRLQLRSIIVHEAYNHATRFNDIAMLETSQALEFGPNVNYIPYNAVTGSLATIIGWGAFDATKVVSTKLREAPTSSPINCDLFPADVFDQNTMFCWGRTDVGGGARPCQYDEGSPLFYPTSETTFYAMGIVSKNLGCGDSDIFETIYTRLSAYYGWMTRTGGLQPSLATE
ncbi:transmembrane protease serine 11D-like [Daphnia carinata]|uniref:transmembrane protease serine 11D-like n=1 Tax=Daphnia carinata TaxID=120202 RepID=UPI002580DBBB|nr:transmembrane protease serine 11D-like [Daphnia carinata]